MNALIIGVGGLVVGLALTIWAFSRAKRYRNELIAVGVNLLAGGAILAVSGLVVAWSQAWIAMGGALAATIVFLLVTWIVGRRKPVLDTKVDDAATKMGLVGYWRDYEHAFKESTGREFSSFVREMVSESTGLVRVIGVDWTELFGAAISGTSEYYDSLLKDSRRGLRVVLHDPRSLAGIQKRNAEFLFETNGVPRYVRNHPDRIYGKILGSAEMLADYAARYPKQVDLRFTRYLPDFCAVITVERIICYPYVRNLKGWDSPVLLLEPGSGGMYETISEYFEYCWQNLDTDLGDAESSAWEARLSREWADFGEIVDRARLEGDTRPPVALTPETAVEAE